MAKQKTRPRKTAAARNRQANTRGSSDLAIDFERYIPTVLSSLVARLRANANVFFTQRYRGSLVEWRILSFLAEHGPASAYDIWTRANLDKAVVSRETSALSSKGFVRITPVKGDARNRSEISLSKAGVGYWTEASMRFCAGTGQTDRKG